MTDMLVKLYALPALAPELERQVAVGVQLRRAIAPEKHFVARWLREHFSEFWVSEADAAFARVPVSCWLAVQDKALLGLGMYDTTARGFFGPTGVIEAARGHSVGRALLLACLHDMRTQGYGYAIIGHVGPNVAYYEKAVGATVIPDSTPGIYEGMLRG